MRGSPSGTHGGPWGFSSSRGFAGVGEERQRSSSEQRRKTAASCALRWLQSPTGCTTRSSGRRRPLQTQWGGGVGTVVMARPEPWRRWRSDAMEKEKRRGGSEWRGGTGTERESGGEWEKEPRRRGRGGFIPSRRRCRRGGWAGARPCSDLGRGNREGRRQREAGRAGWADRLAGY